MKFKSKIFCFLVVICAYNSATVNAGVLWQCDEFPGVFQTGAVFTEGGGGSRHILDANGNYGEGTPSENFDINGNHFYQVVATTASYGWYQDTIGDKWSDSDSTIELRLKVEAYATSTSDVLGLSIFSQTNGRCYGFKWGRSTATSTVARVKSIESSSIYANYNHLGSYTTYRILYYKDSQFAECYYFNTTTGEWEYLVGSSGFAIAMDSKLRFGDYSSSMGGRWSLDYIYWTPGLIPDGAIFCGSPGTTYQDVDYNHDCYITFTDLAVFASDWLNCTNPQNSGCDGNWVPLQLP